MPSCACWHVGKPHSYSRTDSGQIHAPCISNCITDLLPYFPSRSSPASVQQCACQSSSLHRAVVCVHAPDMFSVTPITDMRNIGVPAHVCMAKVDKFENLRCLAALPAWVVIPAALPSSTTGLPYTCAETALKITFRLHSGVVGFVQLSWGDLEGFAGA